MRSNYSPSFDLFFSLVKTKSLLMPSSVIAYARYDAGQKFLDIAYRSGRIYRYLNVPDKIYRDYQASYSKGEFLNTVIKKNFAFQKLS